ncbi:MAG TPA: LytTR family transcriptional regulator, partial [Amaricoccus sp.]|nr:LytTR family transcriptional regulator [Amaricoccus sp.]
MGEMLNTAPDMLILADVGAIGEAERALLMPWIEAGGLLVRFAGPRLAASGAGQLEPDPLLPVRLRAGGRSVGGAMSWGAPRKLRPFPEGGPFAGLPVPEDVDISAQVVAQPDPDLPERVMASLEDGTPLVTGRAIGDGRLVLFHVTANADWS